MRVEVTQEDIANGNRKEARYCPIALALRRLTGIDWCVDFEQASGQSGETIDLPAEAGVFIANFDHCELVYPFGFEAEIKMPREWEG